MKLLKWCLPVTRMPKANLDREWWLALEKETPEYSVCVGGQRELCFSQYLVLENRGLYSWVVGECVFDHVTMVKMWPKTTKVCIVLDFAL